MFTPDGTGVAACSADNSIKIWDTRSHQLLQHYPAHSDSVSSISIHPSGNYLLSSSKDASLKIWDLREGRLMYVLSRVHGIGCTHETDMAILSHSGGGYLRNFPIASDVFLIVFCYPLSRTPSHPHPLNKHITYHTSHTQVLPPGPHRACECCPVLQ